MADLNKHQIYGIQCKKCFLSYSPMFSEGVQDKKRFKVMTYQCPGCLNEIYVWLEEIE